MKILYSKSNQQWTYVAYTLEGADTIRVGKWRNTQPISYKNIVGKSQRFNTLSLATQAIDRMATGRALV